MSFSDAKSSFAIEIENLCKAVSIAFPEPKIDFDFEIDFNLSKEEKENYHQFIWNMAEIGWPAYMDGDLDFHKTINALFENGEYDEIINTIYSHYDNDYIEILAKQIEDSCVLKKDRIPVIQEALELYKLGYYYGSVAILLSQIIGIVKDIESFCEENNMPFNSENEKQLLARYKVSINSDKKRVIAALMEGMDRNDVEREYLYLIGYFRNIVFYNELSEESQLTTDVNRNMVLHGEQLTFGSKEQALKLILCTDALFWVSEVLSEEL